MARIAESASGGLLIVAVLTDVLLLNASLYKPSSPMEWALLVLVGASTWVLAGALLEYAFGKINDKVEANRRRRNVRATGVRALLMPVIGLPLIFAFALSLPLILAL